MKLVLTALAATTLLAERCYITDLVRSGPPPEKRKPGRKRS